MSFQTKLSAVTRTVTQHLHYIGLVFVALLMAYTNLTEQASQTTLEDSVRRQSTLRNLLWTNLIAQRATVTALEGRLNRDSNAAKQALATTRAIGNFLDYTNVNSGAEENMQGEIASIEKLFENQVQNPSADQMLSSDLVGPLEKIGARLNKQESEQWYELFEKNQKLLLVLKKNRNVAFSTYALFLFYLFLIWWLSARKHKSELMLKETEAKLSAAAKMSALGEMAGGMAHEINTPLAIIKMNAEIMQELIDEEQIDRATIKEKMSVSVQTVQRIAAIVQALRMFSRDGSQDGFELATLKKIVDDTLILCSEKLKDHNVRLTTLNLSPDIFIRCRPVQISQVLLNLISNACDAIDSLDEKWIRLEFQSDSENILIRVTDSGHGIDENVQSRLFQPFFTTKEVGAGTGLGLSMSRGIIESHDGTLTLDRSNPHTSFVIKLPTPIERKIAA